ncbi:MAG TPA: polysaccharide deacetylase family protein, partial [Candidatus Bathyarchaeia archaeon]|nr:polysaccharide deacetylase family protein [Candidatus Bathyarchaeia archaeon]
MAEFNLRMIKIFFGIVVVMFVLAMTSGMDILRGKRLVQWRDVQMEMSFMEYKNATTAESFAVLRNNQNAKSIPVLLYHGIITDRNWEEDGTNISLENFQKQMSALKQAGYQTVTMADFSQYMQGKKSLPDKSILITFDDGRRDSYYQADPIFRALGFNAVMFLISGKSLGAQSSGDRFYLGKSELEDMIKSKRWEIQSHGDFDHDWMPIDAAGNKGHFMSNRIWLPAENRNETADEAKKRILADLENSKTKIEQELGQNVFAFAYPFSDFGQNGSNFPESQQFLAENISRTYPLTFYQEEKYEPLLNVSNPKTFMIKRINVDDSVSVGGLLNILSQNKEKDLPYDDSFWNDGGWRVKFGNANVWGALNLFESEELGGNMTILLGSSLWEDYAVRNQARIIYGNSVSQIVRYINEKNYARCNFGTGGISIRQIVDGKDMEIAEKKEDFSNLSRSFNEIGVQVRGDKISCQLNGQTELEAELNPSLSAGGIGFYSWDELPGKTKI